jgi:hypothetical protein
MSKALSTAASTRSTTFSAPSSASKRSETWGGPTSRSRRKIDGLRATTPWPAVRSTR